MLLCTEQQQANADTVWQSIYKAAVPAAPRTLLWYSHKGALAYLKKVPSREHTYKYSQGALHSLESAAAIPTSGTHAEPHQADRPGQHALPYSRHTQLQALQPAANTGSCNTPKHSDNLRYHTNPSHIADETRVAVNKCVQHYSAVQAPADAPAPAQLSVHAYGPL
jgi:hypothetical protein